MRDDLLEVEKEHELEKSIIVQGEKRSNHQV